MPPLVLLLVLLPFRAASDVAVLLLCHFNIFHTDTSAAAKDVGGIVDISRRTEPQWLLILSPLDFR